MAGAGSTTPAVIALAATASIIGLFGRAGTRIKRAVLIAGLLFFSAAFAHSQAIASADDTARLLAGLPVSSDSPLAPLTRERSWQQHASQFDAAFRSVDARQLSRMRAWSAANVTARQPVLFYMFSGPDFLYPNAFFPDAETYVLAALEPTGPVPDLATVSRDSLPGLLSHLRSTMRSSLAFSFFITRQMREEFGVTRLRGTLPILYVYLVRSGKSIREVALVHLDDKGNVRAGDSARSGARGARIVFTGSEGREQTLYYFSTNIANDGFRRSGFAAFCEELGRGDAFIKSASYLLHRSGFTQVRDFLLERSTTILQDDSGVPIARFDPRRWDFRTYGRNNGPIGEFAGYQQPKLKEFFQKNLHGQIDFGFGYHHRPNESGLLLAVNRQQSRPETTSAGGLVPRSEPVRPAPVKHTTPRESIEIPN